MLGILPYLAWENSPLLLLNGVVNAKGKKMKSNEKMQQEVRTQNNGSSNDKLLLVVAIHYSIIPNILKKSFSCHLQRRAIGKKA